MPCTDGGYPADRREDPLIREQLRRAEARVCAVFSCLEARGLMDEVIKNINWQEAGLTQQSTLRWWEQHKEQDRRRRKAEKEQAEHAAREKRLAAIGLAKLTPEERKALGLKG